MKKLAVVLAALMLLSTTTFLAATSPVGGIVSETTGVAVKEQTITDSEAVDAMLEVVSDEEVEAWTVVELEGTVPADGKVTLAVEWVEEGDSIVALHFYNNTWVERPASVVNGKVVVDFSGAEHFSPVIIVKVTPATLYPYLVNPYAPAGTTTLPKTGAVAVLPVAAMACLAGAVVCGRKEK